MSKMSRSIAGWFCLALAGAGVLCFIVVPLDGGSRAQTVGPQRPALTAVVPAASPARDLVNKYCVTCHSDRVKTAGLTLERMDFEDIGKGAEVWEKVLTKVRTGSMPPPNMARPDQAAINGFVTSIETALDAAAAAHPNPGTITIHRLNRAEYSNAIRDLLALDIDARSFVAADDAGVEGFDNMAGALTVSPALVERYMSAARKISRLAVGDPTIPPSLEAYSVPKMMGQDDRISEDLPFASRGGIAIRHRFPVDGEYLVKIKLRGQLYDYILGLGRPHPLEVRLDGERVKSFTVGGDAPGKPAPFSYAGNTPGDPEWENYMHSADAALEVRFPVRAGTHTVGVSFIEFTAGTRGCASAPPDTGRWRAIHRVV